MCAGVRGLLDQSMTRSALAEMSPTGIDLAMAIRR